MSDEARELLREIAFGTDARITPSDRVRALAELRHVDPETSLPRDMLSEVETMTPEALVQEVTEWLPEVSAAASMIPPVREPTENEDDRLAAIVGKLRPDRRSLSWRMRRKLPKTSEALVALVEQAVAVELDQAVGRALSERGMELARRWIDTGVAEAEQYAGASQSVPAVPVKANPDSAPDEPQTAAGGLLRVGDPEPHRTPDGIDPAAGWRPPERGIRSRPPRRLLG